MTEFIVTGSEGGLGRFIIQELANKYPDDKIIRIGRKSFTSADVHNSKNNVITHYGDMANPGFLKEILVNCERSIVIHCAAEWNGFNRSTDVLANNTSATLNLVNYLNADTVRVILISSSGVYSGGVRQEGVKLGSIDHSYGLSKIVSEYLTVSYASFVPFEYTIWRPFHIVSPYEVVGSMGAHVCTNLADKLIRRREIITLQDADWEKTVPLTWVGDVAKCIVGNLQNEKTKNEVFNIGNSELISINEVAIAILETAIKCNLDVSPSQINIGNRKEAERVWVDWFDKANEHLGWSVNSSLGHLIRNFVDQRYKTSLCSQ